MATFTITPSNWNSAAFWSALDAPGSGHILDFTALGPNFSVVFDELAGQIVLSDGTTTFVVGQDGTSGNDATLPGGTELKNFSEIRTSNGEDRILAGDDDDIVQGGDNAQSIEGGTGNDNLFGGAGNDSIFGGSDQDTLDGGTGDDLLEGGEGADTLQGGDGNDVLIGGSYDDLLFGGQGNDLFVIDEQHGNDTVFGGEDPSGGDIDILNLTTSGSTQGISITYTADETGTFTFNATGSTGDFAQIEGFILTGFDDQLDASAATSDLMIEGGAGNDTLIGGSGDDMLTGGAGNDSLLGQDGSDIFAFTDGWGQDTVDGGTGGSNLDRLSLADITVPITVTFTGPGSGNVTDGTNTISFSNIEELFVNSNATLVDPNIFAGQISVVAPTVDGTIGSDSMAPGYTDPEGQQIDGADGNDDRIEGYGGNDTIDAGLGDDTVFGGDGNDSISGASGTDTLDGGQGNDRLLGGAENDSLNGGTGNDTLVGGAGADTLDGGTGYDTADYSGSATAVQIDLSDGLAENGGDAQGDVLSNIEFVGGSHLADSFVAADAGSDFAGNGGADTFQGRAGNDRFWGGDGDDTLDGGAGNDLMEGQVGDDTFLVRDGFGVDTVDGGQGYDTIDLSALSNPVTVVFAAPGAGTIQDMVTGETISFSNIEQLILTQQGDEVDAALNDGYTYIQTRGGDDLVFGSSGADVFDDEILIPNGQGNDSFFGGAGDDLLWMGTDEDLAYGGAGDDFIGGEEGDDALYGGDGADTLYGGAGNDLVAGDEGNDFLGGGDGADTLQGDAGADEILVGDGDMAFGGAGDDAFVVTPDQLNGGTLFIDGGEDGESTGDTLFITGPARIDPDGSNPENGTVTWLDGTVLTFQNIETISYVPCFTEMTLIKTRRGEVPAARLRVGDMVLTRNHGYEPVRWIGTRRLEHAQLARNPALNPVLIRAGALGPNTPERDLMVSPQHRMLIAGGGAQLWFGEDEVFVAALHLTCLAGVAQVSPESVTYVHVMFDCHQIISGDGAWSESFQPGDMTLAEMDHDQRAELCAIFPELCDVRMGDCYPAARITLKRHEVPLLFA